MKTVDSKVKISKTQDMNYVAFGSGKKNLILIPGLGDGLATVEKKARLLAHHYRKYKKDFRVYVISRKNQLDPDDTIRKIAADYKKAMAALSIDQACVYGISQGGMIAECLAIDHPECVEKLVLAVTVSRQTDTLKKVVGNWIKMAESDDFPNLIEDTMRKTYTQAKFKRYALLMPLFKRFVKAKSKERFLNQAQACLTHHAFDDLPKIKCKTLIIGGDTDRVVGKNTSEEMAKEIKHSSLILYKGQGHGAYEEIKTFDAEIRKFFLD